MKKSQGSAYLIPVEISENGGNQLSIAAIEQLKTIKVWCAENGKTFRHFLKKVCPDVILSDLTYLEYDKHERSFDLKEISKIIENGQDIGIVSESGIPSVADPGHILVQALQKRHIRIIPTAGPNSILMALMASGLSGQKFSFHGYLPIDSYDRSKKLQELELKADREKSAEIFMETPYRNNAIIQAAFKSLKDNTYFCIAADISGPNEYIKTLPIMHWRKLKLPDLHKIPSIFIIGK